MSIQESKCDKTTLLLKIINSKLLNQENIKNFKYLDLIKILKLLISNNFSEHQYINIKKYIESINIERLKKNKKIKITFLVSQTETWIGDDLYNLLSNSEKFSPSITLLYSPANINTDNALKNYKDNLKYFKEKQMKVNETILQKGNKNYIKGNLSSEDIYIWLTPWENAIPEEYHLDKYKLNTLHIYIPYGFLLASNQENDFQYYQYNKVIHNLVWKIYMPTKFDLKMAEKYSYIKKSNCIYTGYPKMDNYFKNDYETDPWKKIFIKTNNPKAKKIIYAPHHSVGNSGSILSNSTFEKNYKFILELVEKYKNDTVWIFKPHPWLKNKVIYNKIFKDEKEWEEYINLWKSKDNADVQENGTYFELFKNSDAMILDSISFLAEYLYVGKPELYLTKKGQNFNEFGKELIENLYKSPGNSKEQIENFIENIVLKEKDLKKEQRKTFYDKNLNYKKELNNLAADNIFYDLQKEFMD